MTNKMKDSGIEWIGEIPVEWETSKIKFHIKWKSEKGKPNETVLSLYRDYGVIPKDSRDDNHNVTSLDTSGYKVVKVGDFVINKMKAWQGSMAVSNYNGIVSPAYHVCEIINPNVHKSYLHYLLRNESYLPEYARLSTGMRIGQWDLSFDDFKNIPIILPKIDVQAKIAAYLDRQCAELDSVLEKTRATIDEYKKLKQAVITQAVTKGVRGARPMKDSGVEWIGEIPEHWETFKLKYISTFQQNKYCSNDGNLNYVALENIESWNGKYVETSSVYDKEQALICEKGDVIFGKLRPYLAKVYISDKRQCCSGEFVVIRINSSQLNKFFWYQFISHGFVFMIDRSTYGTKMPRASVDFIKNVSVVLPPENEQRKIVEYLDDKCSEIDALIAKKEQYLIELKNYKKSLIYETTTGKREVE